MSDLVERKRLPNRRGHEVVEFTHNGFGYTAGVGHFDDGKLAEVFLNADKVGTAIETQARDAAISQANKLSRTYAVLLDALNRYRGKEGQQKVTVEHVDVHAGGQAVVGMVESPRGGDQPKSEDQPRAKQIAHAPQPAVWSADKERQPLPVSGDAERPLPDARRDVPGRPEG